MTRSTTEAPTGVSTMPTVDYAAAMTAPLLAVAETTGALGIRPSYLQVNHNALDELTDGRPWAVRVQTDTVDEADRLAAYFGLGADYESIPRVYARSGVAVLDGIGEVEVCIYTGRPKAAEVSA